MKNEDYKFVVDVGVGRIIETWLAEQLPTDIVYTSKLLFAAKDLIAVDQFLPGSRVLLIHSGGLQGNQSLPFNTLPF